MVAFKGVWTQAFWKAVAAEFLAMLIFVLLSLGSTINWGGSENPLPVDMVLISLCFGLSIATMVQCFGHISGGHINPAVTVAMVCTRKISIAKSIFYIAAQCLGAIIGAGILYLVTPPSVVGGLGVTTVRTFRCAYFCARMPGCLQTMLQAGSGWREAYTTQPDQGARDVAQLVDSLPGM